MKYKKLKKLNEENEIKLGIANGTVYKQMQHIEMLNRHLEIQDKAIDRKEIKRKLKGVTFELKHKHYVIKKDGNKLGKRKYHFYLELYFRNRQLKLNTNSQYGMYGNHKSFGQDELETLDFLNKMIQSRKNGVSGIIRIDELNRSVGWRRA
jgi:hypothetical protein